MATGPWSLLLHKSSSVMARGMPLPRQRPPPPLPPPPPPLVPTVLAFHLGLEESIHLVFATALSLALAAAATALTLAAALAATTALTTAAALAAAAARAARAVAGIIGCLWRRHGVLPHMLHRNAAYHT